MPARPESVAGSGTPEPGPPAREIRPASGIYGLIVAASVISVVGSEMRTLPLAVAVVVTLIVYWLAEEYAALIEHASAGHMPTWAHIRAALKAKWPIVSASYIPLLTLLLGRLFGATPSTSAFLALVVIVVLLMVYGWSASRSAGLRGFPQFVMTFLAGGLGLLMILLKGALGGLH
jgi:hypothetical protein